MRAVLNFRVTILLGYSMDVFGGNTCDEINHWTLFLKTVICMRNITYAHWDLSIVTKIYTHRHCVLKPIWFLPPL
jgi:hypothetical protein